jgi:hypothetical protein
MMTRSQKQLIVLGVLLTAIVVVLGIFILRSPSLTQRAYQPKTIDTRIPRSVLDNPEYARLRLPVDLPLVPGRMGRENPFDAY